MVYQQRLHAPRRPPRDAPRPREPTNVSLTGHDARFWAAIRRLAGLKGRLRARIRLRIRVRVLRIMEQGRKGEEGAGRECKVRTRNRKGRVRERRRE